MVMLYCTYSFRQSRPLVAGVKKCEGLKEGNKCYYTFHLPKFMKLQRLIIHFDLYCDNLNLMSAK